MQSYQAYPPPYSNLTGTTRRSSTPEIEPGVSRIPNSAGKDKLTNRLSEAYKHSQALPAPTPMDVDKTRIDFQATRDRLQQAFDQGDYDAVQQEALLLKRRVEQIKDRSAELPISEKLNVMNMNHLAGEAAQNLAEGSSSQQDAMILMGIQNLDKAASGLNSKATPGAAKSRK